MSAKNAWDNGGTNIDLMLSPILNSWVSPGIVGLSCLGGSYLTGRTNLYTGLSFSPRARAFEMPVKIVFSTLPWLPVTSAQVTTGNQNADEPFIQVISGIPANGGGGGNVQQTADGGYLLAGSSTFFIGNNGTLNVLLVKLDSNRGLSWAKVFWGPTNGSDYASTMGRAEQTNDGGYIVWGQTSSSSFGVMDEFLAKFDSAGTLTWAKHYGLPGDYNWGGSVQQTTDGGYITVARGNFIGGQNYQVILTKWNANGTVAWMNQSGCLLSDYGSAVRQTIDEGYIVTGHNAGNGGCGNAGILLSKWDSNGTLSWAKTLEGAGSAGSVQQTSDQGYILTGETDNAGNGTANTNLFLAKLDGAGTLSWYKTLDGLRKERDWGSAVQQTLDGGYIVAGCTPGNAINGTSYLNPLLAKWDANGTLSWAKVIQEPSYNVNSCANSIQQLSSGEYIFSTKLITGELVLVKLDSQGNIPNCTMLQTIVPTVNSSTPLVSAITPSVAPFSPNISDWLVSEAPIALTSEQRCPPWSTYNSTSAGSSSSSGTQPPYTGWIIGAAVGGSLTIMICIGGGVVCLLRKRHHQKQLEQNLDLNPNPTPRLVTYDHEKKSASSRNSASNSTEKVVTIGNHTYLIQLSAEELAQFDAQIYLKSTPIVEGRHLIGKGAFGAVYKALAVHYDNKAVVFKEIEDPDEQNIQAAQNEAKLQQEVSELPHIMPLMDWTLKNGPASKLQLFMPAALMSGKDFQNCYATLTVTTKLFSENDTFLKETSLPSQARDLAKNVTRLKRELALHLMLDILTALYHLHEREEPIIHHDIKPDNILFRKDGRANLADLGCAKKEKELISIPRVGDNRYKAPEQLALEQRFGKGHEKSYDGTKRDLFAAGVAFLEMLGGQYPFDASTVRTWKPEQFEEALSHLIEKYNQEIPHELMDFILKLLQIDPNKRPTVNKAMADELFISHDKCSFLSIREETYQRLHQLHEKQKPNEKNEDPRKKRAETRAHYGYQPVSSVRTPLYDVRVEQPDEGKGEARPKSYNITTTPASLVGQFSPLFNSSSPTSKTGSTVTENSEANSMQNVQSNSPKAVNF